MFENSTFPQGCKASLLVFATMSSETSAKTDEKLRPMTKKVKMRGRQDELRLSDVEVHTLVTQRERSAFASFSFWFSVKHSFFFVLLFVLFQFFLLFCGSGHGWAMTMTSLIWFEMYAAQSFFGIVLGLDTSHSMCCTKAIVCLHISLNMHREVSVLPHGGCYRCSWFVLLSIYLNKKANSLLTVLKSQELKNRGVTIEDKQKASRASDFV